MIESFEFKFTWRADGQTHEQTIIAPTYAEACWRLGLLQAGGFIKNGVPNDFEMRLDDVQAHAAYVLSDGSTASVITKESTFV